MRRATAGAFVMSAPAWLSAALVLIAIANVVLALLWIFAPDALKYDGAVALASAVALLTGTIGGLGEYRRRSLDRLVRDCHARLRSAPDLSELLRRAIIELRQITGTDYNQVMLLHHEDHSSSLLVVADAIAPAKQRYRVTSFRGLVGQVAGDGRPVRAADVRSLPRYLPAVPSTAAELVAPILSVSNVPLGVLNSESDRRGHYGPQMEIRSVALGKALGSLLHQVGWDSRQLENNIPFIAVDSRPGHDEE